MIPNQIFCELFEVGYAISVVNVMVLILLMYQIHIRSRRYVIGFKLTDREFKHKQSSDSSQ